MQEEILRVAAEKALYYAEKKGVEAEAFLLYDKELSVEVVNAEVETFKEAEEIGLGLRIIKQNRLGFAYTSDLSDEAIKQIVEDAVAISAFTEEDSFHNFPKGKYDYPQLDIYDKNINLKSLPEKIELAKEIEAIAKAYDKRIKMVNRSSYEDSEFIVLIMNTNGLKVSAKGNYAGIYTFLLAEDGSDVQNGFSMMMKKKYNDLDCRIVGEEAAANAIRSLNAKNFSSAKIPCIMEPYVMTKFLSLLAQSLSAESVQKGKSMLAGLNGEMVAADAFNLWDDASDPLGIISFPFDGEGVAGQKKIMIENGVLKQYLYDSYTAAKDGVQSTGNGQRGSFRSLPSIGSSNFILKPGIQEAEKLMQDIKKGILITEVMGMHTANPISGDFSVGASGILIENGELKHAVRGITIAANLLELLKDIEAVGNDLRFFGGKASPSVLFKSLSISG